MKSMNKCAAVAVILRRKKYQTAINQLNLAVFAFLAFKIGCKPILSIRNAKTARFHSFIAV